MSSDTISDIICKLDAIIKNENNEPLDQLGSYIVGATLARDDSADFFSRYPMLETIAELGAELETISTAKTANLVFTQIKDAITSLKTQVNDLRHTSMLRDYTYTENWRLLDNALEQFIDLPERLSLVGFKALSPDSFLWQIFDGTTTYYLYAEDFVENLQQVRDTIDDFYQKSLNLEFIPAKKPLAFEDSTPNKTAQLYKPPTDEYEFAKYSSQSGYDFVFLLKAPTK